MIGAVEKISAVAIAVCLGIMLAAPWHPVFAQNEPEPEATSNGEEPHAEPTEFTPVTAGEAEQGAPAASPQPAASPAQAPPPVASNPPQGNPPQGREPDGARVPSNRAKMSTSKDSQPSQKGGGAGGASIIPENSPFAGTFSNQKGPTNVKSDSLDLDYKNKVIYFNGHVHAVQAGGDLTSEKLKVQYGQDFNDIKMMYADNNVRMSQGTRWVTSDHAVLDETKHILTFIGNPVVHDGEDQITGSLITVDLVSGKSTVDHPRVIIFPRENKNSDNIESPTGQ